MAADGVALTLRIAEVDGVDTLQILDGADSVVASQAVEETSVVRITGSGHDDSLTIEDTVGALVPVLFTGGEGVDTMIAPDTGNEWTVTGEDVGRLNEPIDFVGVERLVGGAAADSFVFESGGSLSGDIEGGEGTDTLVGDDGVNSWEITGENAGLLNGLSFTGIENLGGGADADTFVFTTEGVLEGSIDGGAATTMSLTFLRSSSSRAISAASIVLPSPTSSAMKRLTRGSRSALRSGSSW